MCPHPSARVSRAAVPLTVDWPFDAELLRRHDRPGPRYTSYPTAPHFAAAFGEDRWRAAIRAGNELPAPKPLSLYVHVPYCADPCFYCGCNRVITRDAARASAYLARLRRELAGVAPLFDRHRQVVQLHLGGGTPNFVAPAQLAGLIDAVATGFTLSPSPDRDISIELDPRHIDADGIAVLARAGFNRASLGVQDFDPAVQAAVNRVQEADATLRLIDACRRSGFRSVNVDLIYGLPKQTRAGFARTLAQVLQARPDRLAIYGYAHMPSLFRAQRQIDAADLPDAEQRLVLLGLAVETLCGAGYRYIGMDHFALPDDDLAKAQARGDLHRNFMGYTTHPQTDLVGIGVSAISHIGDTYSQNHRDLPAWESAIDAGRLPLWRGIALDADDRLRADVIQGLMCQGRIDIPAIEQRHDIDFAATFREALRLLEPLRADGIVEVTATGIAATRRGRGLLRAIAQCFDRYLQDARRDAA
ncbi:oxygen-independent coproporphyrinogen III oxidase [Chiayiivirga flava]|uniref:Coproporphyrinogen-III oxidase n=1 Tax=Chiayiivirga flava TaxID=659595 RepID=A0A7W8D5F1_9GAMM|nr:oxygen-independent coproporphyrinogen III oxidase [Chiayiivirga flava]MBB5207120.1 oxygen-independent coproporphyrinogen-3 oxidase [Chiayiivirga flava]